MAGERRVSAMRFVVSVFVFEVAVWVGGVLVLEQVGLVELPGCVWGGVGRVRYQMQLSRQRLSVRSPSSTVCWV